MAAVTRVPRLRLLVGEASWCRGGGVLRARSYSGSAGSAVARLAGTTDSVVAGDLSAVSGCGTGHWPTAGWAVSVCRGHQARNASRSRRSR